MSPYVLSALANLLTVVRLPMAAAIWLAPRDDILLLSLMASAAITDMLDGTFARAAQTKARSLGKGDLDRAARLGAWLDPLCDKTFVVSTLAAVYVAEPDAGGLLLLVAAREFILIPANGLWYLLATPFDRRHVFFSAGPLGKATTVLQFLALAAIVLEFPWPVRMAAAALAGGLGIVAATYYIARARRSVLSARERR